MSKLDLDDLTFGDTYTAIYLTERLAQLEVKYPDLRKRARHFSDNREYDEFLEELLRKNPSQANTELNKRSSLSIFYHMSYCLIASYIRIIPNEKERKRAFTALTDLFYGAYMHASDRNVYNPIHRRFILNTQSKIARQGKSLKNDQEILTECIMSELGAAEILQPYKLADAMLDRINQKLLARNLKAVKIDKVARRLKKIAARLKSAEDKS